MEVGLFRNYKLSLQWCLFASESIINLILPRARATSTSDIQVSRRGTTMMFTKIIRLGIKYQDWSRGRLFMLKNWIVSIWIGSIFAELLGFYGALVFGFRARRVDSKWTWSKLSPYDCSSLIMFYHFHKFCRKRMMIFNQMLIRDDENISIILYCSFLQ